MSVYKSMVGKGFTMLGMDVNSLRETCHTGARFFMDVNSRETCHTGVCFFMDVDSLREICHTG